VLGDLELDRGAVDTAITHFTELHDVARELDDHEMIAWANVTLGRALHQAGRTRDARFHLHQAEYFCRMLGDTSILAEALAGLAEIHRDRREWSTARDYLTDALAMTTADVPVTARLSLALAALDLDSGAPRAGEPHARRGVTLARRINAVALLAQGYDLLGVIYTRLGDRGQAHSCWAHALHAYERIGGHGRIKEIRALLNAVRADEPHRVDPDDDSHAGWI
jgi:tetratricopeptide (TPR) repeat protein